MRSGVRRLVEPAGRSEVRVLAGATLFAAAVTFGTTLFRFSPNAPTGLAAALAAVGGGLAALLWIRQANVATGAVHAVVATATAAITMCIAASATPAGPAVTAFGYVWVALYTAWFHAARAVLGHLLLIGGGLALGLWSAGAPSPTQTWLFIMATVGGVVAVLNTLVRRLRDGADRDALTGLLNRMSFRAAADRATATAARHERPVTIAVIDLDDFKLVNDRDGHAAGDRLLRELAASWTGVLRGGDVLGRHGGDEFVLLMAGTTADDAPAVLDRLARSSDASGWTAGVAEWRGEGFEQWLARADGDLYARKAGRSRR